MKPPRLTARGAMAAFTMMTLLAFGAEAKPHSAQKASLKHHAVKVEKVKTTQKVKTEKVTKARLVSAPAKPMPAVQKLDAKQDISAKQMVTLLEVSRRVKADLPYLVWTGELESAGTWNDHVESNLSSAKGIWQHTKTTFPLQLRKHGEEILSLSQGMDLSYTTETGKAVSDAEVRKMIRTYAQGDASPSAALLDLRGNFAVLAFATEFLKKDSGAETRPEAYTSHVTGNTKIAKFAETPALKNVPVCPPVEAAETAEPTKYAATLGEALNNKSLFFKGGDTSQPRTNAEFMQNIASRLEAAPALVRGKFGVGFHEHGGDMATYTPQKLPLKALQGKDNEGLFMTDHGQLVSAPKKLVYGALEPELAEHYKKTLADLIQGGFDKPTDTLSPTLMAKLVGGLQRQGHLDPKSTATNLQEASVQTALANFRKVVGMQETPDNPQDVGKVQPSLLAALETYARRIDMIAQLQNEQRLAHHIPMKALPAAQVVAMKEALGLKRDVVKIEWRDAKKRKHTKFEVKPFSGVVDKPLITAFTEAQVRKGLMPSAEMVDTATLKHLKVEVKLADVRAPTEIFNVASQTSPDFSSRILADTLLQRKSSPVRSAQNALN